MKQLIAFLFLLVASSAIHAQERQVSLQAQLVNSKGTGNDLGYGVKTDVILPLNDFLTAVAELGWVVEPKTYIGDGHAFRGRAEVRLQPWREYDQPFFVSAGGSFVHQRTSQYTKTAYNPTVAIGANIKARAVLQYKHYFTENRTPNRVGASEFSGEVFIPFNDTRWLVRTGVSVINSRFSQPDGFVNAGRYSVWAFQAQAGFAYRF